MRALPPSRAVDLLHGVPFGQPAHPAAVRLPIGCWTSAVLLDWLGGRGRRGRAGVGHADRGGRGDGAARRRHRPGRLVGAAHRTSSGSGWCTRPSRPGATLLFGGSLLARRAGRRGAGTALAVGGLATATVGGYLGGHLAMRLGAGSSHAEQIGHLAAIGWQDLCPLAELPEGRPARRQLGYLSLLAVRAGEDVYVLSDQCSHLGGPLHQGRLVTDRE